MPSSRLSVLAALLAGVLALASASGAWLLAAGIAVTQIVFAMGVVRPSGLPSARPAAWLSLLAGVTALVWIERNGTHDLTPVAVVIGPAVLAAIVVQLFRRDGRPHLNSALALLVAACVLTTLPAVWVALHATPGGSHSVVLALLGVGVVGLAEALPVSRAVRRVIGVVVATTVAAVVVVVVESVGDAVPAVSAVVIAAFSGVMAAVTFAVADRLAGEVIPVEERVLATVPDTSSAHDSPDGVDTSRAVDEPRTVDGGRPAPNRPWVAPMRIAGPFVAAAPTAYILGQLLVG